MSKFRLTTAALSLTMLFSGCNGASVAPSNSDLYECPPSPNCVTSTTNPENESYVPPIHTMCPPEAAIEHAKSVISRLPRASLVQTREQYLHFTFQSRVFGFIDDLELRYQPEQSVFAIRSVSRTGYYDFGVNKARVETLRPLLQTCSSAGRTGYGVSHQRLPASFEMGVADRTGAQAVANSDDVFDAEWTGTSGLVKNVDPHVLGNDQPGE
ncbi:MAG: DUF1499 domain-containing protein [Bdellovibrionales bacterium]|nr:DUF1499 domain-containing protein [Bdellovibrionales bacterium]